MYLSQEIYSEVCWVVLACHKEGIGGSTLSEERKEQIEQLPPPIKIIDPPFEIRLYFSSRN